MAIELVYVETPVPPLEELQFGSQPGWVDSMRSSAMIFLADKILMEASTFEKVERKFPLGPIYRWIVGVERSGDERAVLEQQLKDARAKGREQAIRIISESASRYSRVHGPHARTAAGALTDAIAEIRREGESS